MVSSDAGLCHRPLLLLPASLRMHSPMCARRFCWRRFLLYERARPCSLFKQLCVNIVSLPDGTKRCCFAHSHSHYHSPPLPCAAQSQSHPTSFPGVLPAFASAWLPLGTRSMFQNQKS
jgi:hypothetical protein